MTALCVLHLSVVHTTVRENTVQTYSCYSLCVVDDIQIHIVVLLSFVSSRCEKKERVVPSTPSSAYHVHTLFVIDVDVLVNLGLLICLFLLKTLRLLFDRIGLERSSCGPTLSFQTMNR
eukprot:m.46557 g.46557  ORF g.46557 m.46557 type:complete len:119 (+) comp10726_c1_seq1:673-1029(+)